MINPAEYVKVKLDVKEEKTNETTSAAVEKTRNVPISKSKPVSKPFTVPTIPWSLSSIASRSHDEYSEDIEDFQPDFNGSNDTLAYDTVGMTVNKGLLNIESVFIEDEPPQFQSEIDSISIDDVKKEAFSDDDDDGIWVNDNYNDLSEEPFQSIKCEEPVVETDKKETIIVAKKATKSLNKTSNKVAKSNDIECEKTNKNDSDSDQMDAMEEKKTSPRSKLVSPKTEMERCIPCNRKFHDLAKHRVEFHSGIERPYECFICHKDYKRFEHLRYMHMKTHGDERNYICHVCGEAFFLSNELRKHIMNRHQVERPFKCTFQQCKKCFKNQHALNVHSRTHTGIKPFICATCSESFAALSSLKIHERKHTGAKPYVCKFCNKAFADCSTHRQHLRIHTGEKPYRCHLCDRRTAQAGNLKSHYRHYHKIIVKSVSMFMDTSSSVSFTSQETQRDPYQRNHSFASYPLMDASRRIEE